MYISAWINNKLNRFKIGNIAQDEKISILKKLIVETLDNKPQEYELIFRGSVLDDEKYLSDYDLDDNSEIQLIEKIIPKSSSKRSTANSEKDIQHIVSSYRNLTQNPGFRMNVQRIVRSGQLNDLQKSVPELARDSVAFSILMDPELLTHLSDPDTVRLLGQKHPSVVVAAEQLAKLLHDQNNAIHQQPTTSTGYSYSLDALSDDDDMDSTESFPISRNSSFNAITSAQLAAAIASATSNVFAGTSSGIQSSPGSTPHIITSEMFSNALQQAFDNTPSVTPPVTPVEVEDVSLSALSQKFENELKQMHEMGLHNNRVNLRALQATSGNLHEAVELILNGVLD